MKNYPAALLMVFGFCFMILAVQAAPILDCPTTCKSNEVCSCTVRGCSNGVINLQNKVGQPINMTAHLVSGGFPSEFFSKDNYATSFKANGAGIVGVKMTCFNSQTPGSVEKAIVITIGQNTPAETPSVDNPESKLMAQFAIQQLQEALDAYAGDNAEEVTVLLGKAKAAMETRDYSGAQKYAEDGLSLINTLQESSESDQNYLGFLPTDMLKSIDPMTIGIAVVAVVILIVAIVYIRKRKKKQFPSNITMNDLVPDN